MSYYTAEDLAASSGLQITTVRQHVRLQRLKPDSSVKAKGYRFPARTAEAWLAKVKPGAALKHAEAIVKPRGEWMQSLHHNDAHFVVSGFAVCGAKIPEGSAWHPRTGLKQCLRCMHHATK